MVGSDDDPIMYIKHLHTYIYIFCGYPEKKINTCMLCVYNVHLHLQTKWREQKEEKHNMNFKRTE